MTEKLVPDSGPQKSNDPEPACFTTMYPASTTVVIKDNPVPLPDPNPPIAPTVGRMVWYKRGRHPSEAEIPDVITEIIDEDIVSIFLMAPDGAHPVRNVKLRQEPVRDRTDVGAYVTWMPHQRRQAAKNDNDVARLREDLSIRLQNLESKVHAIDCEANEMHRQVKEHVHKPKLYSVLMGRVQAMRKILDEIENSALS